MAWSDGDLPGVLEAGASRVDRSGSNVILCSPEGAVVMPNNQTRRPSTSALRLKLVPHVLTCAAWPLQTQSGNIARQQRKRQLFIAIARTVAPLCSRYQTHKLWHIISPLRRTFITQTGDHAEHDAVVKQQARVCRLYAPHGERTCNDDGCCSEADMIERPSAFFSTG